jgi:hypothetical protein
LALSSPSIQQLADQHGDMERAVPFHHATLTPGCGAFGFRPADQALLDRFNRELAASSAARPTWRSSSPLALPESACQERLLQPQGEKTYL